MTARNGIVKELRVKRKDLDWQGLIDHICREVSSFDPQQKAIDLTAHERATDTSWLLEPLVRARKPMLLYAEGGQGKSTTALGILVQLATQSLVLPGVSLPERVVKSLFLDWESDEDDTQEVMELLCNGASTAVPLDHIIYRRMSGSLPDHFETIQKDVTEHQIEVVVTDSIIAAGGEEGDRPATAARAYFDVMRALNVASIGITHLSKENDRSKGGKPYGSVYYWNLARDIWRLRQDQVEGDSTADIGLFHEKSNRGGKRKPLGWSVTFGEDAITFVRADVAKMAEVGKQTSATDQILELLRGGGMHIQDIYDDLPHIKQTTVRQALFRKTNTPRFQSLGNERWGLATRDQLLVTESNVNVTDRGGSYEPSPLQGERGSHNYPHRPVSKKKTGVPYLDGVN